MTTTMPEARPSDPVRVVMTRATRDRLAAGIRIPARGA
jgi:hypothetical protein